MPISQWLEYVWETKRGNFSYYNAYQQRKQKSQEKTTRNLFLKVIYIRYLRRSKSCSKHSAAANLI